MEKKQSGQGMDPWGTDTANDTFSFREYALARDMEVCLECGEIRGFLRLTGGGRLHYQGCRCKAKRPTPQACAEMNRAFGLDFATAVELCACCGQTIIPSGSKFSPFFCDICKELVLAFDRERGFTVIPIGRHSFMNGNLLRGKDANDRQAVFRFVEGTNSMITRIDLLDEWKKAAIARNLEAARIPEGERVRLYDYLSRMPKDFGARKEAFAGLRDFFLKYCEAKPEPEATEGRESGRRRDISFSPEAEIRTSQYVIVARIQSLGEKWRSGVAAYLSEYDCRFDDALAVNDSATGELYRQLTALAANGLEMDKDFAVVEVSGIVSKEDGTMVPMPVPWLGAYFREGEVRVFLRQ